MKLEPHVGIGIPVYNGENYIEETIRSILQQTYSDFELIIADNASTDRTAAICMDYAVQDQRVTFIQNVENLGAGANYNLVLKKSSAPFFKWNAHDDQLAPEFLAKSITRLEANPSAVLCITGARRLDTRGEEILRWNSPLHGTESCDPAVRFGTIVRTFFCNWTEIFCLMRREAVARTMVHRTFRGTDIAILAELALLGPFERIDEPLFIHREHADRYYNTSDADPDDCVAWYDPKRRGDRVWHKWELYGSHFMAIQRHALAPQERVRCFLELSRSMLMGVNLKGLARDVGWSIDPRLIAWERRLRGRLRGAPSFSASIAREQSAEVVDGVGNSAGDNPGTSIATLSDVHRSN